MVFSPFQILMALAAILVLFSMTERGEDYK